MTAAADTPAPARPRPRSPGAPVGTFCLVLHSHLPWLAHHGAWPVGEEWLHQAWAGSYQPLLRLLDDLADTGATDLLTLGVTPVVAAQLDDPYCLAQHRTWLTDWSLRALGMTADADGEVRGHGRREAGQAHAAIADFEQRWASGGSPVLRGLVERGTIELLGGPLTHPFLPLLDEPVARFLLDAGLADATLRLARRPAGIWTPECGYRPGLEHVYADAGVRHLMLDGPTLRHVGADTSLAHPLADTDVLVFGRDLDITYRVWSPRRGYPGGKWYRDFHSHDHRWGVRTRRVTSTSTQPQDKAGYEPGRAAAAVARDAADFVATVRTRLLEIAERTGRPGLTVAAYDTELFGHWWHEGPAFLRHVLTALPAAGVRVTTLAGAAAAGLVGDPVFPEAGSWGAGKDWHIWDGPAVADLVADHAAAQDRVRHLLKDLPVDARSLVADQLVRDLALLLASDWAFMVSHDSAAGYARDRHAGHRAALYALADDIERHGWTSLTATARAGDQRAQDGPFGHLDARALARALR